MSGRSGRVTHRVTGLGQSEAPDEEHEGGQVDLPRRCAHQPVLGFGVETRGSFEVQG